MKYFALIFALICSPALAAHPYDSVARLSAGGSGTLVLARNGQGLVITNAHVVATVAETQVYWPAVEQTRTGKTVYVNYDLDLALLLVENPPVPVVKTSFPKKPSIVAAGYPYYDRQHLHWQSGMIHRHLMALSEVSARPVAGMSGGAVFSLDGRMVGVVKSENPEYGYMISRHVLNTVVQGHLHKKWTPDSSHLQEPQDYKFSKQNKHIRTLRYDERTAPELK